MRAKDLAEPYPTVALDSDAMEAAQTMARERRPGLIVADDAGRPRTVLPGSQVLRFAIPRYVQEDPALARVYDEAASDDLFHALAGRPVRELLPDPEDDRELPLVDPDATTIEVAAVMARCRSPLAVVVDGDRILGVITVSRLLAALVPDTTPEAGEGE